MNNYDPQEPLNVMDLVSSNSPPPSPSDSLKYNLGL